MKKENFFWEIVHGKVLLPPCARTMNAQILDVNTDLSQVTMKFEGKDSFTNPLGYIQGGFLTAMLDDTMGLTLASTLDKNEFAPTISLNVHFHNPAKTGYFKAIGKIDKRGSKICHISAEIYQDEKLIASSTSSAIIQNQNK